MSCELNSYVVHMTYKGAIVFDCCRNHKFVTKSYKFLIIFVNFIVVEILILKGIPGFITFYFRFSLPG